MAKKSRSTFLTEFFRPIKNFYPINKKNKQNKRKKKKDPIRMFKVECD